LDVPAFSASVTKSNGTPKNINITQKDQYFHQVHLDLIGLLSEVRGFRYCLIMIDRFSRWPEAIPLPNIPQTVAAAFIDG